MSILGLFSGGSTLLVGLEDDPSGALRAFVGARYNGTFVLVDDEESKDDLRRAWAGGGHVIVPTPAPEFVFVAPTSGMPPWKRYELRLALWQDLRAASRGASDTNTREDR